MPQIIDGKKLADAIELDVKTRVAKLPRVPKLAVILVGSDKASETYVKRKADAATRVGIDFLLHRLPETVSEKVLIKTIQKIQKDKKLCGLIIQIPLPENLYTEQVLNSIDPDIDIDCLTNVSLGRLVMKNNFVLPPTPGAALTIIESLGVTLAGKNVTIVGTGALVGKPLAIIMVNKGASVTTVNSRTTGNKEKCRAADIIITGVGKRGLITADMVKPGAIVIDTGFVFENGKSYGDIAFDEVAKVAGAVTPTPGGVGPITVARLLLNTVIAAERKWLK